MWCEVVFAPKPRSASSKSLGAEKWVAVDAAGRVARDQMLSETAQGEVIGCSVLDLVSATAQMRCNLVMLSSAGEAAHMFAKE